MTLWIVRAGCDGEYTKIALENNIAGMSWDELTDLSHVHKRHDITSLLNKSYPDVKHRTIRKWKKQIWRFRSKIKKGDLICMPSGDNQVIEIGIVEETYRFSQDNPENFKHSISINWEYKIPRDKLENDINSSLSKPEIIYEVSPKSVEQYIVSLLKKKPITFHQTSHNIRNWFSKNKVFFETITATLLSTAAIIVSVVQIGLHNNQISIEKQLALPQWTINSVLQSSEDGNNQKTEVIQIENKGGIAHDFSCYTAVFYQTILVGGMPVHNVEVWVPVSNYLVIFSEPENLTGLIYSSYTPGNFTEYARVDREYLDVTEEKESIGYIEKLIFVRISYEDIFGERHIDYYQVFLGGNIKLSSEHGESVFDLYNESFFGERVPMYEITGEYLYTLAEEEIGGQ